jgi:hypothetical protein
MADTFELYRLSLLPRVQGDLIEKALMNEGKSITREEYLRQVLEHNVHSSILEKSFIMFQHLTSLLQKLS